MKRIEIIPDGAMVLVARWTEHKNTIPQEDIIFLGRAENGYVDIPLAPLIDWDGKLIYRVRKSNYVEYYVPVEEIVDILPHIVIMVPDGENPKIRIDEIKDICGIDKLFKELIGSL
jgi:hypothetical protein